jgi:hypothetical protein
MYVYRSEKLIIVLYEVRIEYKIAYQSQRATMTPSKYYDVLLLTRIYWIEVDRYSSGYIWTMNAIRQVAKIVRIFDDSKSNVHASPSGGFSVIKIINWNI